MKALTIKQPWAWAIFDAGKDIENRNWKTNFRGTVAIHTSQSMTKDDFESARLFMMATFGTALSNRLYETNLVYGAILGTVEIVDCVTKSDSDWFCGEYGFVLKNPVQFATPIPFKGKLGLWEIPEDITDQIFERIRKWQIL